MTTLAWLIAHSALRRPALRARYGPHPRQVVDLHLPRSGGPHPVAIVVHGGTWQAPYTNLIMRPLCEDLVRRGWAAANIGYRRLGRDGGGWPQTFDDVGAAIDLLARIDEPRLDLERVSLVGHSAGGQLALWGGGRASLPADAPGAAPRVVARHVLALAAVCDLEAAGRPARTLLGCAPDEVPERWEQADPMRRIPLGVPVDLVHGRDDETVSVRRSRAYAEAARAVGADVTLAEPAGGHSEPIDPRSEAWAAAVARLVERGLPT